MFSLWHQDGRPRRSGLDEGLLDGVGTGFSNLGFGEDDNSFFRHPRPDSFFSLDGPVGPGRRNDPRDVIKVQTLLGNADRGSFGRFQGPLGIFQDEDVEGIRDWQSRNRLKVDGFLNPAGETIRSLRKSMGNLLGAFKAPTPDEVDEHHAGIRGLGQEKLVWRQPFLKIGGDGKGLPEVPGEDNVHIAKAVDTLTRYHDAGEHPRFTAMDIRAEGPVALARTRAILRGLQDKAPDLADAYLRKLFALPLPEGTREALTGQSEPERIPVGVFKKEWEQRRRPSDTMECTPEKCPPGGDRTLELWKKDGPQNPMRNIRLLSAGGPEGADIGGAGDSGAGGATPGGDKSPSDGQPETADDPEAREREARVERLLRRRAERSGEDPEEAIRRYWEASRNGPDGGGAPNGASNDTLAGGTGTDRPSDAEPLDMEALGREFQAFHKAQEAGEKPDINDYPQLGKLSAMAREAGSTRSRDTERDSQTLDLPPLADPAPRKAEKEKGVQTAFLPAAAAGYEALVAAGLLGTAGGIAASEAGKTTYDYLRSKDWSSILGRTEQVDPPPPTPGYPADPPAGIDAKPSGRPATPEEAPKPLENIPPRIDPKSGILVNPDQREEFDKPFILEARPLVRPLDHAAGDPLHRLTQAGLDRIADPEQRAEIKKWVESGKSTAVESLHTEMEGAGGMNQTRKDFQDLADRIGIDSNAIQHYVVKGGETVSKFELPDGTTVKVRSMSSENRPTLEINIPVARGAKEMVNIKRRY